MSEILRVESLSKSFGGFRAVDNVTFSLRELETTAIIGPNGAGKTTLINLITKRLEPDTGRILFRGRDITRLSAHEVARLGIVRTFQLVSIYPVLSVLENLMVSALSSGVSETEVRDILEALGLTRYMNTRAGLLPFGVRKLVELGMALAMRPKLLLLDEPVAGLLPSERENIVELLKSLGKRLTIVVVEHDMNVVFSLAERIIVMNRGRVVASGTPTEIAENSLVREIYLGEG